MSKKYSKKDVMINDVPYKVIELEGSDDKPSWKLQPKIEGDFSTVHFKTGESHIDQYSNKRKIGELPVGTAVIVPVHKGNNEIGYECNRGSWAPGALINTPGTMTVYREDDRIIIHSSTCGEFVIGYVPRNEKIYLHKD